MEFRILGPLEVLAEGRRVALSGDKQRALLALFLIHANRVLGWEQLIDELWGERPPASAAKTLQVHVSRLRKALERASAAAELLVTRERGYELRVDPGSVDAARFERLVGEARGELAAGRVGRACSLLEEGLSLWRGPPLAEFAYERFAEVQIARLEELRMSALEELLEAKLALGRHAEVVGELESLIAEHPYRERLRAQLMLALYRCDRQAEALQAYQDTRHKLVEELGIEPGQRLRELERAILAQDPALAFIEQEAALPRPASEASRSAFVGREGELGELIACLEDACAGRGRLVLLAGEAGIGKSRLADELITRAEARGARVLVGRCWEAGGAPAYWPWAQSLRGYVRDRDVDSLRAELGSRAAELAQLVPEVGELLGGLQTSPALDSEGARFRLFESIAAFLGESSRKRPLALVIDDLHAADTPSLMLLRFAARELVDSRVLILAAYRDTELGPEDPLTHALAELAREPITRRIELAGLDLPEVAELIARSADGEPPNKLAAAIHAQTEGNPLFIGELVRLLRSQGALDRLPDPGRAMATIPSGIREVIAHRLRHLSAECKRVLGVASVLGREFSLEPLRRVTRRSGDELLELLDEAVVARALLEVPASPGRLRFAHVLIRDVLYQELSVTRRIQLHWQIGETLEEMYYDQEPRLAELAHHFSAGAPSGDADKAAEYAQHAAEQASAQLAYEEAVRLYGLALAALELEQSVDEMRRCELLLGLGEAQAKAGEAPGYQQTFRQAAEIARRVGGARELAAAALGYGGRFVWARAAGDPHLIPLLEDALAAVGEGESIARARLLARLAGALRDQPSRALRTVLARQAVEIARRLDDAATLTWALDSTHVAIWGPDTVEERIGLATEMLEVAKGSGSLEAELLAHDYRLYAFFELGDMKTVHSEFEVAVRAAAEIKQPAYWWKMTAVEAIVALFEGRFDVAETLIEHARELGGGGHSYAAVAHGLQIFALRSARGPLEAAEETLVRLAEEYPTYPVLNCALAALHADLGREPAARALFERLAAREFGGINRDEEWLLAITLLVPVCSFLGDVKRAAILYRLLTPFASRNGLGAPEFATGSVSRSLAILATVRKRWQESIRRFQDAIEANERMGARPWLAHAQHDYARALLARGEAGDRDQARELLTQAADAYRELRMDPWVERAASLQRTCRPPVRA